MAFQPPRTAYIALGSNLVSSAGDPEVTVLTAMARLTAFGRLLSCSSLYATEPVGYVAQPAFVNAVAAVETILDPEPLLQQLLAIEREFGRDRAHAIVNGPRTLDLDLLLLGDLIYTSPTLTLPHPSLARRRFVLAPLSQIAPDLTHPVFHVTMSRLLDALPDQGETRVGAVSVLRDIPPGCTI